MNLSFNFISFLDTTKHFLEVLVSHIGQWTSNSSKWNQRWPCKIHFYISWSVVYNPIIAHKFGCVSKHILLLFYCTCCLWRLPVQVKYVLLWCYFLRVILSSLVCCSCIQIYLQSTKSRFGWLCFLLMSLEQWLRMQTCDLTHAWHCFLWQCSGV